MNPLINTGIGDETAKIVATTNLKLYILYIPYIASTGDRFYSISIKGDLVHSTMAPVRAFSYLITLLCLATSTVAASDGQGQYIIKPSQQSRSCISGSGAACSLVDNGLTLS